MNAFIFRRLMICNYINKLPRCQEDQARFLRTDTKAAVLIAKQTQGRQLEVGELGYLSSVLVTPSSSSSRVTGISALMMILTVLVRRCQ